MSKPIILMYPDGHHRRIIFEIGPFIADYPEQVYLTGIMQRWCPNSAGFDVTAVHESLSLIKGTFKDHLITWVEEYLHKEHSNAEADRIMDDIDRRIAAAPAFPGLRHFLEGRNFKQWTGDDSKALMKVFLPAIVGHVSNSIVKCIAAFLDFCYLVRQPAHDTDTLATMDETLHCFHHYRQVFVDLGIHPDGISLPQQHSLVHYVPAI
ncbi:hypothetical protein EWM64_g4284 [Hericium alpestre]|uniref:Uncharacterized protein n=1 Tax=Hericium alpestre TaxID=135208 RepID=A0A4Y9ZZT8_9AGAM|nr:hypothetical protein EWM64_g4284 [Hericium alpestre]